MPLVVHDGVLNGLLDVVLELVPVMVPVVVTNFSFDKSNFSETKIEEKVDIIILQKHSYNSRFDWM